MQNNPLTFQYFQYLKPFEALILDPFFSHRFSDDFKENSSQMICLNMLNIRRKFDKNPLQKPKTELKIHKISHDF